MFNLGFSEMLILGTIALIVIGPKDLPTLARTLGRTLNDLKRSFKEAAAETTGKVAEDFQKVKSDFDEVKVQLEVNSERKDDGKPG